MLRNICDRLHWRREWLPCAIANPPLCRLWTLNRSPPMASWSLSLWKAKPNSPRNSVLSEELVNHHRNTAIFQSVELDYKGHLVVIVSLFNRIHSFIEIHFEVFTINNESNVRASAMNRLNLSKVNSASSEKCFHSTKTT